MIQPDVLRTIAKRREFRGRGLLARFLYARPMSKLGSRKVDPEPVSEAIKERYENVIIELALGMARMVGDPAILKLTSEAQAALTAIEEAVEPTLAPGGDLDTIRDWGGKYVGAIARIAGNIHLAEYGLNVGLSKLVSAQTITDAHRIGEYFRAAAINTFAEMGTDEATADAVYLWERIQHLGRSEVSERDIQRAAKRFKTRAELLPPMQRLIGHGYLEPLPAAGPTGGRPRSREYRVYWAEAEK